MMTKDAAARAAALDPARSFIVQAPAGSGKTELLTQRVLRLLATVEAPEQILAITFTRKAAAEMRSRILRAIDSASGPAPASTHKRTTWALATAVCAVDKQRGWRLAQHPARLRVQTIDALNAQLARRLPILAGTGAALEPTDDSRPLYEAACGRLIGRLGEDSAEMRSLETLIGHLGNRLDHLIDLLIDLLAKRDQWLHPVVRARTHDGLREALETTLRAVIERHLARLCDGLIEPRRRELFELAQFAAENLLGDPGLVGERRRLLEACLKFGETPGADSKCLRVWQAIAGMLFNQKDSLYQKVNKQQGFPTTHPAMKARLQRMLAELSEAAQLCEQLAALRTLPDPVYSPEQWRVLEALLDVLPLAVAELQLVFQAQGKADYVEAALRALRALGPDEEPTDLALAFDYRIRHLLVDEFQDTSFGQLDLLERLTAGWSAHDGRTLFCVGDPMQSIYRFRQAEVGLFLLLQTQGLPNVALTPLTLSANFRSVRPLVEWVNRVFPAVLAPENDAAQGAVKYSRSDAAIDSESGGVHVHPSLGVDELAEATGVISVVRQTLARDADSTIAVLVTARTHVGLIAREFTAAGIDFQAVEIEQLDERPVVRDLMALTRALVHLADRTAWLAVLRAPWCGSTLAELHALVGDDRKSTIHELLAHAGSERQSRASAVLDAAVAERGRWSLREWVERAWNALGGAATLARLQDLEDAEAFFRRLGQIESMGDLDDVARLEQQLDRLFARPRADGQARVEVMTIHKAKGLEFDTVILPALHRGMRGEERELLRWTRIAGRDGGIVFAPLKAEGAEADSAYRWIELLEKARDATERARLLYVASTRAKRDLHLFGAVNVNRDETGLSLREPRAGTMLSRLWHELKPAFEAAAAARQGAAAPSMREIKAVSLRRLPVAWRAPAADPSVGVRAQRMSTVGAQRPEFDWVGEVARHVGTLVHRELDRLVRARIDPLAAESLLAARARLIAELAELGVPPDRCHDACDRVIAAIEQTLSDSRGRWLLGIDAGVSDAESELALSGCVGGEIIEGVIDRTFVDEQGVRWVVDFKTSTHEGGGLDQFLHEEAERYRPQLARYARLMRLYKPAEQIRAALYFPLLRQWREVAGV